MSTSTRRFAGTAIAMAAATTILAVAPATASAATPRNGVCEAGEFCLYYYTDRGGSVSDFTVSVANYGTTQPTCYDFKGPGAGKGECIKNNAESAWNRSSHVVSVYFNSNYGGASDTLAPNSWENLHATFDENASHKFF